MATPGIRITAIAAAVAAAVGALAAFPAHAFRVDYVVDAGVEHDDNVHVEAVDADAQTILRAGIGFVATQEGSTVQAVVSGRADYRNFDGGDGNTLEGVLSGYLNWVLLQDRLSFTVQDELELQAIDRFAADAPGNRQQINVLSLGPNLLFDLGSTMRGRLEARYIDTDAEVTEEFNSARKAAALRVYKDLDAQSELSLNTQWMDVDYDRDLVARDHRRADLYARYQSTRASTDYTIDAGYSRLDYDDGARNDGPLLRLEAGWRPREHGRLSLTLVNQYSDTADTALATGSANRPPASVPGSIIVDSRTVIPSVFRERRVALAYQHAGERLGWRVEPYLQRLRYLDAGVPDEDSRGVMLGLDYRITPSVSVTAWAGLERIRYTPPDAEEDHRRGGIALHKRWSRHWSTSLSYYRYERDSELFNSEVSQNVWYLRMTYRNRPL